MTGPNKMLPVLVVDDEADIRQLMNITLTKMGLAVRTAEGVAQAKELLSSERFSLVLTDMRMPDGLGLEVVEYINNRNLDVPVAIITAYGDADEAVQALKSGAFDYLQKPITLAQLRTLVKSVITISHPAEQAPISALRERKNAAAYADAGDIPVVQSILPIENSVPRLMGRSPLLEEVRQLILKLAKTDVSVYISGESGSGKELAARSIHELSARADAPFIAVNCGAIPENLMESEFFGYRKGSFTGAETDRDGLFRYADGGTLFLDEVADLPPSMQVKLLRAIQEKKIRRIGDSNETAVDVRIISATHKNLQALVAEESFRQDLFYRLNVVSLEMPPLREMREDLPFLVMTLLRRIQGEQKVKITKDAQKALLQYSYPGNFRELENILERAVALAQDQVITVDDLQISSHKIPGEVLQEDEGTDDFSGPGRFRLGKTDIQDYLDEVERGVLEQALEKTRYNRTQAAKLLGISFRSMRYRMERLGIE